MERFDIRGRDWGLMERQDGLGAFTWAEEALAYKASFRMAFFLNVIMVVVCALLSAYLVFHKHDPVPVQKVSVEQSQYTAQLAQQYQAEKAGLLRRIEDLGAILRNLSAQLRTQNANNAKLVQQLKELHASVPAQPIILEAIRKEANTDKGLRQAVARSFGGEIANRMEVR